MLVTSDNAVRLEPGQVLQLVLLQNTQTTNGASGGRGVCVARAFMYVTACLLYHDVPQHHMSPYEFTSKGCMGVLGVFE